MKPLGIGGFVRAMLSTDRAVSNGRTVALYMVLPYVPCHLYVMVTWRWSPMELVYFSLAYALLILVFLGPSKITDAMRAFAERGAPPKPEAPDADK